MKYCETFDFVRLNERLESLKTVEDKNEKLRKINVINFCCYSESSETYREFIKNFFFPIFILRVIVKKCELNLS